VSGAAGCSERLGRREGPESSTPAPRVANEWPNGTAGTGPDLKTWWPLLARPPVTPAAKPRPCGGPCSLTGVVPSAITTAEFAL
jgi:hypothetical protein